MPARLRLIRVLGQSAWRLSLAGVAVLVSASLLSGCGSESPASGALTPSSVSTSSGGTAVQVANLTVEVPPGWDFAEATGGYEECSHPIGHLWVASYPLPAGFSEHEGPLVVPPGQLLLGLTGAPVGNNDGYWESWRVSNDLLEPADAVDGSEYRAELVFAVPAEPSVRAVLWAGSQGLPAETIETTNRLLSRLTVDRDYGCQ
jgi:hypothetical protein